MQSRIWISHGQTYKPVEADVLCDLTTHEIERINASFHRYKEKALRTFRSGGTTLPAGSNWDWSAKILSKDANTSRFFGIRYKGLVQRLIMLNMKPVRSLQKPFRDDVLYVEFIESAPWNQKAYAGTSVQFAGVGLQLVRIAAEASVEAGCEGRLALHSLPQSESFYRPKFDDLGIDPDEGLRYFELSSARATSLLHGDIA